MLRGKYICGDIYIEEHLGERCVGSRYRMPRALSDSAGCKNLKIRVCGSKIGAAESEPIKNSYHQMHSQILMACPEYNPP